MKFPEHGVAILHGNTVDVYPVGKKSFTLLELIQRDSPYPVVYTTGRQLQPMKIEEETWKEWYKPFKPMLEGPPGPAGEPALAPPPAVVLNVCLMLARAREVTIVVDYAEMLLGAKEWDAGCCSSTHATIMIRACDETLKGIILLVCRHSPTALHPALRSHHLPIHFIELPMPDEPIRKAFGGVKTARLGGLTLRQLSGLGTDDAFAKQAAHVERATDGMLRARWCEAGWELIGGHEQIVTYLRNHIAPAFKRRDRYSPVGMIWTGGPGTGKSLMAEVFASDLNEPLFEAFGGFIRSSFVGENERVMTTMLRVLEGTGGILYMDEGDKMFSSLDSYQGDSGVQTRVIGSFMQWLADPKRRGKVLTIMSMNRPYALPAAMRRAGRFDIVVPFFSPAMPEERALVIRALCKRHEVELVGDAEALLAKHTDWWTGADIEAALVTMAREVGSSIKTEVVMQSLKSMRPALLPEEMREMNKITAAECRDRRLLPPPQILGRIT